MSVAVTAAQHPVVQQVVKTVVQNHTVVVDDLKHVLNLLILLVPTGAFLSVVHWVVERDRLSANQNRAIAWGYSIVGALIVLTLNHTIQWSNLWNATSGEAFAVAFVAVAGAAQKTFDLLTVVSTAQQPKAASVEASPDAQVEVVNP